MILSNMNEIPIQYEPYVLVDDISGVTKYTGISQTVAIEGIDVWRIKKEWKVGNVLYMGFPNGNQNYAFSWSDRENYTYE